MLVGVSARSLAEVEDTITVTQFRTLVVLDHHGQVDLNRLLVPAMVTHIVATMPAPLNQISERGSDVRSNVAKPVVQAVGRCEAKLVDPARAELVGEAVPEQGGCCGVVGGRERYSVFPSWAWCTSSPCW